MIGYVTGHTCGDACWHARDLICHCSCGGKNHGIFARGGNQPDRTARINGSMYKLVEVGPYREIEKSRMDKTKESGHDWYFDPCGPFVRKVATKSQLSKWPELSAYPDGCDILWQKL